MSLVLRITLIFLAVVVLIAASLAGWYFFYRLRKPQVFLVGYTWDDLQKEGSPAFDADLASKLATYYSGIVATKAQLTDAISDGLTLQAAGYVSDETGVDAGCKKQPIAWYPMSTKTGYSPASACSRGYWIMGVKPFMRSASFPGKEGFVVQEWSDSTWNRYEADSVQDFFKALFGRSS